MDQNLRTKLMPIISPKTKTVRYIPVTSLIPQGQEELFGHLADDAPFSWGDNDITLVTVERFVEHLKEVVNSQGLTEDPEIQELISDIQDLGDTYPENYAETIYALTREVFRWYHDKTQGLLGRVQTSINSDALTSLGKVLAISEILELHKP